jgi:hypothetical protein
MQNKIQAHRHNLRHASPTFSVLNLPRDGRNVELTRMSYAGMDAAT